MTRFPFMLPSGERSRRGAGGGATGQVKRNPSFRVAVAAAPGSSPST